MDGKAFEIKSHFHALKGAGLITFPDQLKDGKQAKFAPPGKPKKVDGMAVYPHFG